MRALLLILLLSLAACGGLPQPFFGNPGSDGARLAQPPAGRLSIPLPGQSLLADDAAMAWARATAAALLEAEVPASATAKPAKGDWTLALSAQVRGDVVIPSYEIRNPKGEPQGVTEGQPVPAAAWAQGDAATLRKAADQAAPGVTALLNRIEAARRQSDPNSLLNRPARVFLAGVTGAPGDGNRSLPTQMRIKMTDAGLVVQDTATNADYKLEGEIQTAKGANGTVRIELQWVVSDARGERGRILQINEVPPQTINPYWGDVAVAVASEAAPGVRDVIANAAGTRTPPKEDRVTPPPPRS